MDTMQLKILQQMIKNGATTAERLMASGLNVNALRTNSLLRKDEWKHYDTAVIDAAQQRMVGVSDLYSRGLVYRVGNGLGKTVLEYEDASDMADADVSMDGVTRGRNDRIKFGIHYLPLPITHKDWNLSIRVLNATRSGNAQTGNASQLDTTQARLASLKVSEKIETYLFNGSSSFTFGGGVIYGYLDAPNANTGSLAVAWDDSSATGTTILNDVRAMKQASIDARHFGPWMLYIPTEYETKLDDDFKANSDKTIRMRLKELSGIVDVKVADKMTSGKVVLVQMTEDVTRIVEGMPITNVEWTTDGGMISQFKVMSIMVPHVRSDQDSRSGVTVYSE